MGNLDNHEITLLDEKYDKMMADINVQIISRLTKSTILFDTKNTDEVSSNLKHESTKRPLKTNLVHPDSPCPCGSGKKFCECHGSNIRSGSKYRRRR